VFRANRKRSKFNLSESEESDEEIFKGFTHKGRPLEFEDDFKDHIADSESENDEENPRQKGQLTEEAVNTLNFGQGGENQDDRRKTRKEVFEEIISKSRAFKQAKAEMADINKELRNELDTDYGNILSMLNFEKPKVE